MNKNNLFVAKEDSNEVDLGRIFGSIIDYKWLIFSITSLAAILGILYTLFATPIYQADALVQVESTTGSQIIQNMNSLSLEAKPVSMTEIELIESRMVLGKTVDDLGLDVTLQQKYFPVLGKGWARLTGKEAGRIALSRLRLPSDMYNVPMTLIITDKQHYQLKNDDGEVLVEGQVGQLASKGDFGLLISGIETEPGTEFEVVKHPTLGAINNIANNLLVEDKGKDTGVLSMTYTGPDKELIRKTLDSITQNYLLQNIERKSAEAEKSLNFLQTQIPKVRATLDDAENKLNTFRQQNDSVDLSLEARSVLDSLFNIDAQLNQLTFKEAEISKLYTKEHPAYRTLLENRKTLENEKAELSKQVSALPKTQQEILRLTRDVDANQAIYMQLLNRQQELNITRASTVGNVRIVDPAVTLPEQIAPKSALIILGSVVVGLVLSLIFIILRTILHRGVESPAELEEAGINVYASVPLSEWQQKVDREFKSGSKKRHRETLLALNNLSDPAIEAVRSLRTSLHFAMLEARNNILMISGASPSIGKTFISSNLAALIAQAGQRVLLIDGDLRKGYVHEMLGLNNQKGLTELLSNQTTLEVSIQNSGVSNFDIITRGQVPPNPSELLMGNILEEILAKVSTLYDMVLIDTPPILAVTDAAVIGHHVGTSLLVARYGINTLKEIEISINRFSQNGTEVKGVILNSVFKHARNVYSSYGYYEYKSDNK
ncbi:Tyrosine-protein kinase wzc [Sodalis glossinidius str. 'morsitans']|uniref:Tyrosine-protein kinase wzc n=1 Tax=Sodalis glossinidius (strain morsitans) TaxID=343509 RepID=A0A193QI51_SODGM|nr:tyrosine-protein kinase Wzc [Sodalis glossinidius]CRL44841.1 Tyrosine-protein kinase wzc [Sodalis glossinidius str. 'morsitans']